MRRKLSKLLLMITVVCMSVMTLVLAACSNTSTEPQKPAQDNTKVNTVTMLKDVISNLKASYALDKTFGIDVAAKYLQDDKNDDTMDVKFELNAKGNVDVNDDATENATNFVIELNKVGVESKETMFGIAYEVIDGKPYFFVNLLNGGYEKINGFSILSLYKMANAQVAGGAGGINIESLIAYVAPILFGDTGKVENGVYTFNFDLANLVNEIEGFIPLLTGALNMSTEDLDSLVAIFCKNMTFSSGEAVDSLADLVDYVNTEMSFSGTIAVEFNADKKFTSSSLTFDYANGDEGKTYTFSVDKAFVGITNTPIDTFNGFALTEDARKQNQAYNLLNFSLDGSATGTDANNEIVHRYSISVDSDIDPFVFFGLLESTSKEKIVECLKAMGYFHLEINEVNEQGVKTANIMTIHTVSSDGNLVLLVDGYDQSVFGINIMPALGGVYDFEALVDVIGMLTAPKGTTATADGGINVGALLAQILGFINADNMQENGVTIELKNLVGSIAKILLGETTGGLLNSMVLPTLLGSEKMNIKLQTPVFGECETIATNTITADLRTHKDFNGANKDLIKEIVSLDGASNKILIGDEFSSYITDITKVAKTEKPIFKVKGKNLNGDVVDTLGFIMAMEGLDVNKAGKQSVTFYIAIPTDLIALDKAPIVNIVLDPLLPLFGTLKYTMDVEVMDFDASRSVSLVGEKENFTVLSENPKLLEALSETGKGGIKINIDGLQVSIDDAEVTIFDKLGKDVTKTVYKSGKIEKSGYYTAKFSYKGYFVEKTFAVAGAKFNGESTDKIALGQEFVKNYKLVTYTESGEEQLVDVDTMAYKLGYSTKKESDLFDTVETKLNLKKDLSFIGQKLVIILTKNVDDSTKLEASVTLTIEGPKLKKPSGYNFGSTLNNALSITIDKVEYLVSWDKAAAKWVAKSKDGKVKDISLTLKWKDKNVKDVKVNENGVIVEYDTAKDKKIFYRLECDGYYFETTMNVTLLSAGIKYSHKIDATLNGYISNVDKIYYEKEGKQVTLEFKYGKDGYAIYEKGTDNKVYDVTMKITKDSQEVQLVDGKFAELGKYRVEYEMTINGINQKFYQDVTVK